MASGIGVGEECCRCCTKRHCAFWHPSFVSAPWTRLTEVCWTSPPLFDVACTRNQLEQRFGPPSERDLDSNGVGEFDAWLMRFSCELEVAVWLFHRSIGFDGSVSVRPHVEVHANERDADHILFHLGLRGAQLVRWKPDPCPPVPPRFRMLRLDDNGRTFEVACFTSRCEAEAEVAGYEARGHKQTYWLEPVPAL